MFSARANRGGSSPPKIFFCREFSPQNFLLRQAALPRLRYRQGSALEIDVVQEEVEVHEAVSGRGVHGVAKFQPLQGRAHAILEAASAPERCLRVCLARANHHLCMHTQLLVRDA
jgi:hypothetical protein